jgi:hypothetical protein
MVMGRPGSSSYRVLGIGAFVAVGLVRAAMANAQTPTEIAVQAVQENDPAGLSFSDYEFILSYRDASPANKVAGDHVWKAIQEKQKNGAAKLKLPGDGHLVD